LLKKYLSFGVILLFIGLALSPSLSANINKKNVTCKFFTNSGVIEISNEITECEIDKLINIVLIY